MSLSPTLRGMVTGAAISVPFFIIGFASGEGPRYHRLIEGNPKWIILLEVLATAATVASLVLTSRAAKASSAAPIFSFLGGFAASVGVFVAVAVFFKARSSLTRFGLKPDGSEEPMAGTLATKTRESHNVLGAVDAFLAFLGAFAITFVVMALLAVVFRSLINTGRRLLKAIGVLPPDTIADF